MEALAHRSVVHSVSGDLDWLCLGRNQLVDVEEEILGSVGLGLHTPGIRSFRVANAG